MRLFYILEYCFNTVKQIGLEGKRFTYSTLEATQRILLDYVKELDPMDPRNRVAYMWLNAALNVINDVLFR